MRTLSNLFTISFIAGIILLLFLKMIMLTTGNPAYVLLVNFDYVPVIQDLKPVWLMGYIFHFITCIVSVIVLYYVLKFYKKENNLWIYVVCYTLGGGALFFLTSLSPQPPAADDFFAWFFWTLAHFIFGLVVGALIRFRYRRKQKKQLHKTD